MNKMSNRVTYTDVNDEEILRKAIMYGCREFVRVKLNANIAKELPFPSDYDFSTECFLSKPYLNVADRIFDFKIRPDDVWVVSFPKAGSTWLSNIVWQLQNNLDFSKEFLPANYNYLEPMIFYQAYDDNKTDPEYADFRKISDAQLDLLDKEPSPRLFKSHLPAHLLPTNIWTVRPKLIYIYRDVKDVAISTYHMYKGYKYIAYKGSMEDCFDSFLSDNFIYSPFFAHVKGYKKLVQFDHVLVLNYEQLVSNTFEEVRRISKFLNRSYTNDQLKQLVEHVSFRNMNRSKMNMPFTDGFK